MTSLISFLTFAVEALAFSFAWAVACGVVRLLLARNLRCPGETSAGELARLEKGDVLLFGKRSILRRTLVQLPTVLTRRLEDRFWVHAGVYAGNGIVWESRVNGVTATPFADYKKSGNPIRVLRHRYVQGDDLDRVIEFCRERRGRPYAFHAVWFHVLANLLPGTFRWLIASERIDRAFREDEKFTCCELVVEAFAAAAHPLTSEAGWRVIATDLLDSPVLFDPLRGASEAHAQRTDIRRAA